MKIKNELWAEKYKKEKTGGTKLPKYYFPPFLLGYQHWYSRRQMEASKMEDYSWIGLNSKCPSASHSVFYVDERTDSSSWIIIFSHLLVCFGRVRSGGGKHGGTHSIINDKMAP